MTSLEFKKNLQPGYVSMPSASSGGCAAPKELAVELTKLYLRTLRKTTGGFGDYAMGHSPVRHAGLLRVKLARVWAAETPLEKRTKDGWREFYSRMRAQFDFSSSNIVAEGLFIPRRDRDE